MFKGSRNGHREDKFFKLRYPRDSPINKTRLISLVGPEEKWIVNSHLSCFVIRFFKYSTSTSNGNQKKGGGNIQNPTIPKFHYHFSISSQLLFIDTNKLYLFVNIIVTLHIKIWSKEATLQIHTTLRSLKWQCK